METANERERADITERRLEGWFVQTGGRKAVVACVLGPWRTRHLDPAALGSVDPEQTAPRRRSIKVIRSVSHLTCSASVVHPLMICGSERVTAGGFRPLRSVSPDPKHVEYNQIQSASSRPSRRRGVGPHLRRSIRPTPPSFSSNHSSFLPSSENQRYNRSSLGPPRPPLHFFSALICFSLVRQILG